MKRHAIAGLACLVMLLAAGAAPVMAQASFKVPFPFQAGGRKLPAGDYTVLAAGDGQLALRQAATGKEIPVAVAERIAQPAPAPAEARLVFDEVGDFVPSYTEYITVYVLSEVWLAGQDGFRTHTTKGAHNTKVIKAAAGK
jgi:hypothetical protein